MPMNLLSIKPMKHISHPKISPEIFQTINNTSEAGKIRLFINQESSLRNSY
jgi:hypothetical protein